MWYRKTAGSISAAFSHCLEAKILAGASANIIAPEYSCSGIPRIKRFSRLSGKNALSP